MCFVARRPGALGARFMVRAIRLFLSLEATAFIVAAFIHFGMVIVGYAHRRARLAQGWIPVGSLLGLALTWIFPRSTPAIGMAVQGFALLGTLVGVVMTGIGIGPQTAPDVAYHIGMVVGLVSGVGVAARAR